MSETQLSLCNQAFVLIGAGTLGALTGTDARAVAGNTLYQPAVNEIFALHPWRFAMTTGFGSGVAVTDQPWSCKLLIPSAAVAVRALRDQYDNLMEFDRYDNYVYYDALTTDTVYLEYTRAVAEGYWPEYFTSCVRAKLAALFAVAIAEDTDKASAFEGRFIRLLTAAKLADSQGRTNHKMPVGRFAAVVQGRP